MSSRCPMCSFESPTLALGLSHLRLVHGSDPRFCVQCGIDGCSYTGRSFSALYSHIYRKHKESGIIRQRGCTVVLQSHAEVTERCTETADAEPSPDINTEPEMQGMARYCYASMHVYIYIYIYIYYGKHQCSLYTIYL